jgi:putative transcriptional regulator
MIFGVITFQLKKLLKANGKTLYWLSKETGIAYNTLHTLNKGEKIDVRVSTIERICKALNCTPNDLLVFTK